MYTMSKELVEEGGREIEDTISKFVPKLGAVLNQCFFSLISVLPLSVLIGITCYCFDNTSCSLDAFALPLPL